MLGTWFLGAPVDQIRLGNVGDLLAYGFFYKSRSEGGCRASVDSSISPSVRAAARL